MARKSGDDAHSKNGFNDVIGIALLALALLLLVAQLSFDRGDLPSFRVPPNKEIHNWIGTIGAYLAWFTFLPLGIAAYLLPWIFAAFGAAYLLDFLGYLRERLRWCVLWTALLFVAVTGLLHLAGRVDLINDWRLSIDAYFAGGWLGYLTYGRVSNYDYGFVLLGRLGATIVYAALGLIAALFLTNFQLGNWIRALVQKVKAAPADEFKSAEEIALEKRAAELEKQKRVIEAQVEKVSGLGADGQPVPEPTVRDLSVPQAKGPRYRKSTLPPEPPKPIAPADEPMEVGEVIHAGEVGAATTDEILGKKTVAKNPVEVSQPEPVAAENVETPVAEKPGEPKAEPVITIADGSAPAPRPKPAPRKPKPMTVASVPMIGNYQLPSLDFLQHADMTV